MPKKSHKWNNRVFPICDFFLICYFFWFWGIYGILWKHIMSSMPQEPVWGSQVALFLEMIIRCQVPPIHAAPASWFLPCWIFMDDAYLEAIKPSQIGIVEIDIRRYGGCSPSLLHCFEGNNWKRRLAPCWCFSMFQQELCVGHPLFCVAHVFFLGGLHKLPAAFWSDCVEALFGHAATRRHLIPGYHSGSFETCFVQFSQDAPPADEVVKIILSNIDVGGICKILKDWSTSLSLSASFNNMCITCGHQ